METLLPSFQVIIQHLPLKKKKKKGQISPIMLEYFFN